MSEQATLEKGLKARLTSARAFIMLFALGLIWLYFHWATDSIFLTSRNLSNLMLQTSVTGILAVGMLMVIVAGQIDLSIGSVLGLAGGVSAIVLTNWGYSLPVSILSAVAVGIAIGCFSGRVDRLLENSRFHRNFGRLARVARGDQRH